MFIKRLTMVMLVLLAATTASAQVTIRHYKGQAQHQNISNDSPNRKALHIILDTPFNEDDTDRVLGMAHDLGASLLRVQFDWARVEPTEGTRIWSGTVNPSGQVITNYDYFMTLAQTYNLQLVMEYKTCPAWANSGGAGSDNQGPPQDFAKWANIVTAMLNRYKVGGTFGLTRRVIYGIEVFNEPNDTGALWKVWNGSTFVNASEPARWADMVNQTITAAHAADSGVKVVTGPLCTSLSGGCSGSGAWDTYMDAALAAGLNKPDAVGWNGVYSTLQTAAAIIADMGPELPQLRTKINSSSWSGASTVEIWCMECGSGNVPTCNPTPQSAMISAMYGVDGVHDQLKIDPRYVAHLFYRIMQDTAAVTAGACDTTTGCGGFVFYAPQFPVLTPCTVAAGYAKPAYTMFQSMPATP